MKISKSLTDLFESQEDNAKAIQNLYEPRLSSWAKDREWHYADRIKKPESYAQKIEQSHHELIDDVYAGTIIVKNRLEAHECCKLLEQEDTCRHLGIIFQHKRPNDLGEATFPPDRFLFDSIRMYFKAGKPDVGEPDYLSEVFEIQIKTLIDEAWGKASHGFFYKTDDNLSWAKERLMSQIKALLESAETALNEAGILSESAILQKEDKKLNQINAIMDFYREGWTNSDALPNDLRRLATSTHELLSYLNMGIDRLKEVLQVETEQGRGSNIINLSPYWIVVASIAEQTGWASFLSTINSALKNGRNRGKIFPLLKELEWPETIDLAQYTKIRKIA